MKLSKICKTIKAAERYQNLLYGKYDKVVLVQSPRFTEDGNYIWDCQNPVDAPSPSCQCNQ